MKILIASGGSGGHIFPAVALARTLEEKRPCAEIRFVGSNKDLDRRIFEKEGFRFWLLSANKLPYKRSLRLLTFFIKLKFDILKAFFIIVSYRPDVVVGFGGYAAFPIIFAARILGIPRIAHEQNVVPGRANKFLFGWSDTIAISFDETKIYLGPNAGRAVFTGNPIRYEIFSALNRKDAREAGIKQFGLDPEKFTILVIGGSQGAHFLNETFIKALSVIKDDIKICLQVIHITGPKDYEWAIKEYEKLDGPDRRIYSFIDRIEEAYSASSLVVTRSGASAIFEIAFFAKPMILVPYPFAMSHQAENAHAFCANGAAIEIEEAALSAVVFRDAITGLFNDRVRLNNLAQSAKSMSMPEASDNLAKLVLRYADK